MAQWINRLGSRLTPGRQALARRILRLVALLFAAAGLIYLLLLAVAPLLVSTGMARNTLEDAVSDWTGQQARIDGLPSLRLFPHPRISLPKVTIFHRTSDGRVVLARIDRLSASFGLIDGILGKPLFDDFEIEKADIRLTRAKDGTTDWQEDGLLAKAIKADKNPTDTSGSNRARIGSVRVIDGRIRINDAMTGRQIDFNDINARLSWPKLSSGLSLTVDASLAGRHFGADISSSTPLKLLGGSDADLDLHTRLPGFTGHFDGTVNLAGNYQLEGPVNAEITDAPAFEQWSGMKLRGLGTLMHASFAAQVTTVGDTYRLDRLQASFDQADVTGIIEISPRPGAKAVMNGTLAFDEMDFDQFLDSVMLLPVHDRSAAHEVAVPNWLDVDITLSAQTASFAGLPLSDVATSLTVSGDHRRVDVIDSTLAGGTLTAMVNDAVQGGPEGQIRLSIENADFGALNTMLHLPGPMPASGNGTLTATLALGRPIARAGMGDLSGEVSVEAGPGVIRPLNLAGIARLAGERTFFHLGDTGSGDLAYTSLSAHASLSNGTAELTEADIATDAGTISLGGLLPLTSNGLALSATLTTQQPAGQTSDDTATQQPLSVFIGGAWPDPVLSSRFPLGAKSLE
ncbi:AsmA family protein [Rhizobium halophytocola]|uniref:AsmA protein n=1 Tax=Rhizobium halophytocola TaxID=735519 RepID=A0ABS4E5K2_9HYPH|nr:AsmA family protein [Rhizobium halophytocola]MBP1853207.1 AsmA protein [Rhizobium halophytocola]